MAQPSTDKKDVPKKIGRRDFLKSMAAVGAVGMAESILPSLLRARESKDMNEGVRSKKEVWEGIKGSVEKLRTRFGLRDDEFAVVINPSHQELYVIKNNDILRTYRVSTAKSGIGNTHGSGMTPMGTHRIREKIGDGAELGTIFKAKQDTGEKAEVRDGTIDVPGGALMTTRILSLYGQEPGINEGRGVDTYHRHIYIHGTSKEGMIGKPDSHGCIRMNNQEVVKLYDLVSEDTLVEIQDKQYTT